MHQVSIKKKKKKKATQLKTWAIFLEKGEITQRPATRATVYQSQSSNQNQGIGIFKMLLSEKLSSYPFHC